MSTHSAISLVEDGVSAGVGLEWGGFFFSCLDCLERCSLFSAWQLVPAIICYHEFRRLVFFWRCFPPFLESVMPRPCRVDQFVSSGGKQTFHGQTKVP
jgi:hypothetical protein